MQATGRVGRGWPARFFSGSSRDLGEEQLGARLRTRKVTGRDASLPAPLLATSLGLVGRGTVGALPQTPAGTLSLHPARDRRKGTKSPLDPFSRLSWSRFLAPSACSFLALRRSPCLLPKIPWKTQIEPLHVPLCSGSCRIGLLFSPVNRQVVAEHAVHGG